MSATLRKILVLLAVVVVLPWSGSECRADLLGGGFTPKVEIKKFRFRRHNTKNFERLVIEFASRGGAAKPTVRVNPAASGKETNIVIEQVQLVGAIPEALINDSYVPKSKFMGPVSINTDGPTVGFNIRTFLKEPVSVDAFWTEGPNRLVLDVFPANSPRMSGRVSEADFYKKAGGGSVRRPASVASTASDNILCYPLSAAVSASVTFNRVATQNVPSVEVVAQKEGPEPVICFFASSAVVAQVAFRSKPTDENQYVQLLDGFQGTTRHPSSTDLLGGPSLFAPPAQPGAPVAPGTKIPSAEVVIPNIEPGRTPLGSPLVNPATIQRLQPGGLPGAAPLAAAPPSVGAPKLPSLGGAPAAPPVAAAPQLPSLGAPPAAGAPVGAKPGLNPSALLPPTK